MIKNIKESSVTNVCIVNRIVSIIFVLANLGLGSLAQSKEQTQIQVQNNSSSALEAMAEENPTLGSSEILLKAYKESSGQIPEFVTDPDPVGDTFISKIIPNDWFKFLVFLPTGAEFQTNEIGTYLNLIKEETVTNRGPLVGNKTKVEYTVFLGPNDSGFLKGTVNKDIKSGLSVTSADNRIGLLKGTYRFDFVIEFRAYNKNIVIFTIRPTDHELLNRQPDEICGYKYFKNEFAPLHKSGYCSIGYAWKN